MPTLNYETTGIAGLMKIWPRVMPDPERGDFTVWFNEPEYEDVLGISFKTLQEAESGPQPKGTIRGIHAEPWQKLARVVKGRIFVAITELRLNGQYGRIETMELGPGEMLYIPKGVGNAFEVTEEGTEYHYMVTGQWQGGMKYPMINPLDPDLNIQWLIKEHIISDKDRKHPAFSTINPELFELWQERQLALRS